MISRRPSILKGFGDAVETFPDQIATETADSRWTFSELARHVAEARAALIAAGLRPAELVRIVGTAGPVQVAYLLATWQVGAVAWLVEQPEPTGSTRRVPVLTVSVPREPANSTIERETWLPEDMACAVEEFSKRSADVVAAGGGYLIRTSGSSGRRKYVLGSYGSLSTFVAWQATEFGVGRGDRVAAVTTVEFDVVYRELLVALTSGATLVFPPAGIQPGRTVGWLGESRATIVHAVPSIAQFWLMVGQRHRESHVAPRLRLTFFAGEPLDGGLTSRWRTATGPRQTIVNLYGPTETTLAKFYYRVPPSTDSGVVPVGRPLPRTAVQIRDPATGATMADGAVGEVIISTEDGSLGYLGKPPGAEKLRRYGDVVVFATGDRGCIRPAGLTLHGRLDTAQKINGIWVDPHDVERVLRECDGVDDVAVVAVRSSRSSALHAFIVTSGEPDMHDLRSQVRHTLGTNSVPAQVTTVARLPTLCSGKVDRSQLVRVAGSNWTSGGDP